MFTTEDKLAMKEMLKELGVSDPIKLEYLETIQGLAEQSGENSIKIESLSDFVSALNMSLRTDLGKILENQIAMQADITEIKNEMLKPK